MHTVVPVVLGLVLHMQLTYMAVSSLYTLDQQSSFFFFFHIYSVVYFAARSPGYLVFHFETRKVFVYPRTQLSFAS